MDHRMREDDTGRGMDPRVREDDVGMDPRMREDDGKCTVMPARPPSFLRRQESIPVFFPTVKPP